MGDEKQAGRQIHFLPSAHKWKDMKQLCDAFEFLALATVLFSVALPPCHTELSHSQILEAFQIFFDWL